MLVPSMLACGGNATAGKDALFQCLKDYFQKTSGIECKRVALGDYLKADLDPFFKEKFGISAFTADIKEKTMLRPLMVEYAKIRRADSQGQYFTEKATPAVETVINNKQIPVITDLRYGYYPKDELQWLRSYGGVFIFVQRILPNGLLVQPPNEEEAFHNSYLAGEADLVITWRTELDYQARYNSVLPNLKGFFNASAV
jgi:hypothetical protein